MCKSKDEYLTRPDLGRRFDEKNQAVLRDLLAGQRVVLAVGDGLSSAVFIISCWEKDVNNIQFVNLFFVNMVQNSKVE